MFQNKWKNELHIGILNEASWIIINVYIKEFQPMETYWWRFLIYWWNPKWFSEITNSSCLTFRGINPEKVNNFSFLIILTILLSMIFSSVQSISHVRLFATPWTVAHQASLSIINSWSLLKLMSIESVMPTNHLILCCPLLLLPSISPSIKVFFQWVSSLNQAAKVLELQLQHQSVQWIFRADFL